MAAGVAVGGWQIGTTLHPAPARELHLADVLTVVRLSIDAGAGRGMVAQKAGRAR